MARSVSPSRIADLVEIATRVFIARGYRQAQMSEVAEQLAVAKGTVYGYVESKEALFDAAVRYADGHNPLPEPADLPLRTPPAGATVDYIRERLVTEGPQQALARVVAGTLVVRNPVEELRAVVSDLYRVMSENRFAIKLIDRCAADHPGELHAAWFGEGRWMQHGLLAQLIRRRLDDASYRAVADANITARMVLESIAFWALHRHFDPSPQDLDEDVVLHSLLDFLGRALVAEWP